MALPEPATPHRLRVTYHDACSLRNAQMVTAEPRALLRNAGCIVSDVPESHFCCGSAGTYNLLQADMAQQLGERKAMRIASTSPQIVAAGNIGCLTQIAGYSTTIVHTIELLDWAHGGEVPPALRHVTLQAQAPDAGPPGADTGPAGGSHPIRIHPRGTAADTPDQAIW